MKFNVRQQKVINADDKTILCLACAGAGKTTVLTERIRRLVNEGCDPKDIIAITFTNTAADEMKKRLGDICVGMFIGTIHSLANSILIANGVDMSSCIANGEFDKIIDKALTFPKKLFPHVKYLLIDEFQDTCERDYRFFQRIQADNFFAVGDERQVIFQFRGSTDKYLRALYNTPDCTVYNLNQNYRCAPNILKFAENLIASMHKISLSSIAMKTKDGYVKDDGTFIDAIEEIEWSQDYGNWFVLCRTNDEVAKAQEMLNEREIPNLTFKKGDLDNIEMERLLKDNRVKVLTIHAAKGLENKHVVVIGAKLFNEESRKLAYVAATRAQQSLYWCPSICSTRRKKTAEDFVNRSADVFKKARQEIISFE